MDEGRAELQKVTLQYEKQRAEAIRSKRESEVVLPYLRAALEELDSTVADADEERPVDRAQVEEFQQHSSPTPVPPEQHHQPVPDVADKVKDTIETPLKAAVNADGQPPAAKPSFACHSIASLVGDSKSKSAGK